MSGMGIEGVIDAAFAYISANQVDKFAEVRALDWSHDLGPMPPFAAMRMVEPVWTEGEVPALCAVPMGDDPAPGAGGRARPVEIKDQVTWVVMAIHNGTAALTPAEASWRLAMRYLRAVRDMLKEMHDLDGPFPWTWKFGQASYALNYARESGEWFSDAQLRTSIAYTEAA
jgi:hypothetical protein